MVSHESPCLTFGPGFLKQQGKPLEKGRPVGIIEKNVLSLDPPHNDMLEDVQVIYSSGSWHGRMISKVSKSTSHQRPLAHSVPSHTQGI